MGLLAEKFALYKSRISTLQSMYLVQRNLVQPISIQRGPMQCVRFIRLRLMYTPILSTLLLHQWFEKLTRKHCMGPAYIDFYAIKFVRY